MSDLDYLGGTLENFYAGDIENPHLIPRTIIVKEGGKILARGTAAEIKNNLKGKYNKKIIGWDAYYDMVTLTIEIWIDCFMEEMEV